MLVGAAGAALMPLAPGRVAAEAPMRLLAWPMLARPLRRAAAEASIASLVEIRIVHSDAEMLAALRDPTGDPWDLAMPTERAIEAFLAEDLLRPLASSPCDRGAPWGCDRLFSSAVVRGGSLFAVGPRPALPLIASAADIADEPPTSWREFWHFAMTAASGRTVVPESPRTLMETALSALGFASASPEPAERTRAEGVLRAASAHISAVADPLAELVGGRAALALLRYRDRRLLPERCPISIAMPVEQGESWATLYAVPRRSRRHDAAERVIAAILGDAAAATGVV